MIQSLLDERVQQQESKQEEQIDLSRKRIAASLLESYYRKILKLPF
ncbi:MAG: hypothetical protein WAK17_15290 [Candidatus Nitrosopolaris sp.]